jgi:hypothetical protein
MADREEVRDPGITNGYRCDFCAESAPVWLSPTCTHAVYQANEKGPSAVTQPSAGCPARRATRCDVPVSTPRTCTHPGGWVPGAPPCIWTFLSSCP